MYHNDRIYQIDLGTRQRPGKLTVFFVTIYFYKLSVGNSAHKNCHNMRVIKYGITNPLFIL